jgi:pentatricopeptide repeat protein
MEKKNVPPDNMVTSTLIYWLCKNGMVREARNLFDELERGFKPSLLTYNSLISGLCENEELQEAGRVWDDMVERGYEPNAMTYEALIKGLCKTGKPNEGATVFEEMVSRGCKPSSLLFQVLVDSLSEPRHEDTIRKILETAALYGRYFLDGDSWEIFVRKVVNATDTSNKHLDLVLDM